MVEDDNNETPKDETPSVIEQAEKLHNDIKSENDRREKLIERDEELYAKRMLGGKTSGGQEATTPQEQMEAEAKKEADEIVNAFR